MINAIQDFYEITILSAAFQRYILIGKESNYPTVVLELV